MQPIKEIWSDIDWGFRKNLGGSLRKLVDIKSVEASIDTILLTPLGTRKFLPEFGSRLENLLFEPIHDGVAIMIKNEVRRVITKWDPRLVIRSIKVIPYYDDNSYDLSIEGYISGVREFDYSRRVTAEH